MTMLGPDSCDYVQVLTVQSNSLLIFAGWGSEEIEDRSKYQLDA